MCVLQGCEYRATQRGHLAIHALKHSEDRPFKCPTCGKTALASKPVASAVLNPLLWWWLPLSCGFTAYAIHVHTCTTDFATKRKEHLKSHMRKHSDDKPFKCPTCGEIGCCACVWPSCTRAA